MSYALYAALYARVLRAFGGNTPFLVSDTPISFSLFKAVFRGTLYKTR